MERLAGIDAAFLYLETNTSHMHVVGTAILEPGPGDRPFDFQRLLDKIQARLHLVPSFRRRLRHVPLRLGHPVWVDDPDFRVSDHVHRIALPAPGSERQLSEFVAHVAGVPLDRERPLWEMWVVDGLEDGGTALVSKFHHAAIDGVTGADLMRHIFDVDCAGCEPTPATAEPWTPEPVPSDLALVAAALRDVSVQPLRIARSVRRTAASLARMSWTLWDIRSRSAGPALPFAAPRTCLNHAVSADRTVAFGRVRLADVKRIKNAYGVTVNDVVLTLCSLALREYLAGRDDLPAEPLTAVVPVSLHGDASCGAANNAISAMFVSLPVYLKNPRAHLEFIRTEAAAAKALHRSSSHSLVSEWAEYTSPTWLATLVNLYSSYNLAEAHSPLYNLVISNVPGPPVPLYCAGSRVRACYPLGPIFEGAAVNITVMSYCDSIGVGVIACPKKTPGTAAIAEAFESNTARLLRLVTTKRPDRKATRLVRRPAARAVASGHAAAR
jgi:WS/DGAT/MGAT family acyltransferase